MSKIGDALFSRAQQPVLTWIFGDPERWFHVKELIRLSGLGSATVQRELARLEKGGLIETRRVANLKQFRAFAGSPIFHELRLVVLKTFGLGDVLRNALMPLAPEIKVAFVYGSVAQNRDHATSDIDLLVVSDTLTYGQILAVLQPAENELARPIQVNLYTAQELLERKQQNHHFIAEVLREPKLMLIGTIDDIDHARYFGSESSNRSRLTAANSRACSNWLERCSPLSRATKRWRPRASSCIAYDAAHAASRAALRAFGYRSDDRYLLFQCLEQTVGWPAEKWRILDTCHRRRNAAEYEGNVDLPASLTAELVELTAELIDTASGLADKLPPLR